MFGIEQELFNFIWLVGAVIYPGFHYFAFKRMHGNLDYDGLTWIGLAIVWPFCVFVWVVLGSIILWYRMQDYKI